MLGLADPEHDSSDQSAA